MVSNKGMNMTTVSVHDVQARLPEIISAMQPGEEVLIDHLGGTVAKLVRQPQSSWPCQPGSAKHRPHRMSADFNEPLEDFREYMA